MTLKTGYVIGGHHARQFEQTRGERLVLPLPSYVSPRAPIGPVEVPTEPETIRFTAYEYVEMQWRNSQSGEEWKYGFWVPADTKNPQPFIIEELLKRYVDSK